MKVRKKWVSHQMAKTSAKGRLARVKRSFASANNFPVGGFMRFLSYLTMREAKVRVLTKVAPTMTQNRRVPLTIPKDRRPAQPLSIKKGDSRVWREAKNPLIKVLAISSDANQLNCLVMTLYVRSNKLGIVAHEQGAIYIASVKKPF